MKAPLPSDSKPVYPVKKLSPIALSERVRNGIIIVLRKN